MSATATLDGAAFGGLASLNLQKPTARLTGTARAYVRDTVEMTASSLSVKAGQMVDLGDVELPIWPMSIAGIHVGQLVGGATIAPFLGEELPNGAVDAPYDVWVQVHGGVRDLTSISTGVPTGMVGEITMEQCENCHNTKSPFVGEDYVFDFESNKEKGTHEKFPLKYTH